MALRGLTVSPQGDLLRDGVRFRNIGLNAGGLVQWIFDQPSNTACKYTTQAERAVMLDVAKYCKAKVLRVKVTPLWPVQWTHGLNNGVAGAATAADRVPHWNRVKVVLDELDALDMGMIAVLNFRMASVPDLVGQQLRAGWLTPGSATRNLAQAIYTEFATLFKDHPGLYGYEFANEDNHYFDAPYTGRPQVDTNKGTRPSYSTAGDMFSPDEYAGIIRWFYGIVSGLDSDRLVGTGHGPGVYFQPGGIGGITTPIREWYLQQIRDNPTNAVGFHWYGDIGYGSPGFRGQDSIFAGTKSWARSQRPVRAAYVGELGNQHRTAVSASVSGDVLTVQLTNAAGSSGAPIDVGDDFYLLRTNTALDGTYVAATVSGDRRTITAQAGGKTGSWSGSATFQHMTTAKTIRTCDDFIRSGLDLGMWWCDDIDPVGAALNPLESITVASNAGQRDAIRAANTILGN